MDAFWEAIDTQLELLKKAKTADDVLFILRKVPGVSSGHGFFAGGGGHGDVASSLSEAGWTMVTFKANYDWCMEAPNGDLISYVEGDIYRGNSLHR